MPYQVDPDLLAITADAPPRTPAPRDDWRTLREQADVGLAFIDSLPLVEPEYFRAGAGYWGGKPSF